MTQREIGLAEGSMVMPGQDKAELLLRELCQLGLADRYRSVDISPEVRGRLNAELDQIVSSRLCTYFLMIWDLCSYARSEGIPFTAHGSSGSTIVGYLLGLSNVDPLQFGLLFEHFADLSKPGMPKVAVATTEADVGKINGYIQRKYVHLQRIVPFEKGSISDQCVVISNQPIENILARQNTLSEKSAYPSIAECGFLEVNFFFPRQLAMLQLCMDQVRKRRGIEIEIEKENLLDEPLLGEVARGGLYEFRGIIPSTIETSLGKLHPECVADLVAMHALSQPRLWDKLHVYADCKQWQKKTDPIHPLVDRMIQETYGVVIFEEQLMQIFNQIGGIDLARAWKLIDAYWYDDIEPATAMRAGFIGGAYARGIEGQQAEELYDSLLDERASVFCKSQSVQSVMIALQLAYMKVHHPEEFEFARAECTG